MGRNKDKNSLSKIDKEILKILLAPSINESGSVTNKTSKAIATKLGVPATTVQRRRKRLEKKFLTVDYSPDFKKFNLHQVDFLIATERGKTLAAAKALLKLDDVTYVARSIGQHTIDLRVETVLIDNADILRVSETLKGMAGVKDVIWTEIVEVVGRKTTVPLQIVEKL